MKTETAKKVAILTVLILLTTKIIQLKVKIDKNK